MGAQCAPLRGNRAGNRRAGSSRPTERSSAVRRRGEGTPPYGRPHPSRPYGRATFPKGEGFWGSAPAYSLPRWRGRGTAAARRWWMRWSHSKRAQQEVAAPCADSGRAAANGCAVPSLSGRNKGEEEVARGRNPPVGGSSLLPSAPRSAQNVPAARRRRNPSARRAAAFLLHFYEEFGLHYWFCLL